MSRATAERQRQDLANEVAQCYRQAGSFAYHFARNKVRYDPFFTDVFRAGLASALYAEGAGVADGVDVLDLGCGQGLLAVALALARPEIAAGSYHGIEYSASNVARAQAAFATLDAGQRRLTCVQGNIVDAPFPAARLATVIDVLHYLPPAQQEQVLRRIRTILTDDGKLLLRVGDADARQSNQLSQWIDRVVSNCRGGGSEVHCRGLPEWLDLLRAHGFLPRVIGHANSVFYTNVMIAAERS